MAVLSAADRELVWAALMRTISGSIGVTKTELRIWTDAIDQWIEDNQASLLLAMPEPSKSDLTDDQLTLAFAYVAMKRAGLTLPGEK